MAKKTILRLLKVTAGTRSTNKRWMRPIIHADYRIETETRAGRKRLRAIKHQGKLRHKRRLLITK